MTTTPNQTTGEAIGRLQKFVQEWQRMDAQRDDEIYGLHIGDDREAVCRVGDIETILAALQSPTDREGDRMEWRSIKSAPKDGTEILICGGTYISDLSEGGPFHFPGVTFARWANVWGHEGWQGEPQAHDEYLWHKPELWMLAPEAPTHLSRSIVGEGE